MRMRMMWLAALAALLQGGTLAAQATGEATPAQKADGSSAATIVTREAPVVAITQLEVEVVMPALKAEATGGAAAARAEWGKPGPGKGTLSYDAVKNALLIARLDSRDAGRLAGLDKGTLELRKTNREAYRQNWDRLDALLDNVVPGAGCSICRPAPRS